VIIWSATLFKKSMPFFRKSRSIFFVIIYYRVAKTLKVAGRRAKILASKTYGRAGTMMNAEAPAGRWNTGRGIAPVKPRRMAGWSVAPPGLFPSLLLQGRCPCLYSAVPPGLLRRIPKACKLHSAPFETVPTPNRAYRGWRRLGKGWRLARICQPLAGKRCIVFWFFAAAAIIGSGRCQ
jgi:hypothetical protein